MKWGLALAAAVVAPMPAGIWHPDQHDGTYANPVLNGDYSDPDVIRVGDNFYLVSSSFVNAPGLPVLQSKDLVNWTLIGHALPIVSPQAHYAVPRRGGGVWAPSIRFHGGRYYIYYPDPDFGIFVISATDPAGPWSSPILVDDTKGAIDPCPFWDDNGQGYLVHAYAGSRAGFSNVITLKKLSPDGTRIDGAGTDILKPAELPKVATSQGLMPWFTTEGPKLYKRNGYYYVFAPAGSVKGGWQGVFRSRSITGPYEGRDVMDQGHTSFNGPHQGAWVTTPSGQDWFIHFQDTDTYGRRVLLEPMSWGADDWPVIGHRQPGEVFGEPVARHSKPDVPAQADRVPAFDDSFVDGYHLGWQWNSNPARDWVDTGVKGMLRLNSASTPSNLWEAGNVLSQKLPGTTFSVTVHVHLTAKAIGERAGLVVLGQDYAFVGLENAPSGIRLVEAERQDAAGTGAERTVVGPVVPEGEIYLRARFRPVTVRQSPPNFPNYWPSMLRSSEAEITFSYSDDGLHFVQLGSSFTAVPGRWVGAQVGIFAQAPSGSPAFVSTRVGHADFDAFKGANE